MYTHQSEIIRAGLPLDKAEKAIILLHGRGATAASMVPLADRLELKNAAILAPQATNHSWYPYSFLAPVEDNQPSLGSALNVIADLVEEVISNGLQTRDLYFLGFSQGACLTLEYTSRNAANYGGIVALTGGLIGEELNLLNYRGDFENTKILITTGDPDPHVPVSRVEESVAVIEGLNARVTKRIYRGRLHTIQMEELQLAKELIFS